MPPKKLKLAADLENPNRGILASRNIPVAPTNTTFPLEVTRGTVLSFRFPVGRTLYLDWNRTKFVAVLRLVNEDGSEIKDAQKITVASAPIFAMIRRYAVYSRGQFKFSQQYFNYISHLYFLSQDAAYANSVLAGEVGFMVDSQPMDHTLAPEQNLRREMLTRSKKWALSGTIPIQPFVQNDCYIPSTVALGLDLELEGSDFVIFRDKAAPKAKLQLVDAYIDASYVVVPKPGYGIKDNFRSSYKHYEIMQYQASKGQLQSSSGQLTLNNFPDRVVIFFSDADTDNQLENPYNFELHNAENVELQLNEFHYKVDVETNTPENVGLYSMLARVLGPQKKKGGFLIKRDRLNSGYGFIAIDCSRSSTFEEHTIDVSTVKESCIVNLAVKHAAKLKKDINVNILFLSNGILNVSDAKGLSTERI